MLEQELKDAIQQAYSHWLNNKGFKARPSQRQMIAQVARTLGGIEANTDSETEKPSQICVIEAGTGTGKTLGYLLAAQPIAKKRGKKLVVATATILLQNQLADKDLPDLREHSGLEFDFAVMKGRGRYLCISKLAQVMSQHLDLEGRALFEDEEALRLPEQTLDQYEILMEALDEGDWSGDIDEWSEKIPSEDWARVTTDHHQCTNRRCTYFADCPYFKARNRLDQVDIAVANHDLVLADLMLGGGVLLPAPEDTIYIFDEGHHLPDKAIKHFSAAMRIGFAKQWLDQIAPACAQVASQLAYDEDREEKLELLPDQVSSLKQNLEFVEAYLEGLEGFEPVYASDNQRYRFEQGLVPDELRLLGGNIQKGLSQIYLVLVNFREDLNDYAETGGTEAAAIVEKLLPKVVVLENRVDQAHQLWQAYARLPKDEEAPEARWLILHQQPGSQLSGSKDYELFACPVDASTLLQELLWDSCYGAVVTSATLSALGNFERYRFRSGVPEASAWTVMSSPFDYANLARLCVPKMSVDPTAGEDYTQAVIGQLNQLLPQDKAVLVLFSSRHQLQEVYKGIDSGLREAVLQQDEYAKQTLVKKHKEAIDANQPSVIFGLTGMAEGIDLPGGYLTHVVIVRLPFAVPDDPVEATQMEWITQKGGNPFWSMTVPDAALRLKQACGRLLRSEKDTGRVTILDNRLLTKGYGKALLDSLPPFSRELGC